MYPVDPVKNIAIHQSRFPVAAVQLSIATPVVAESLCVAQCFQRLRPTILLWMGFSP
jgi:hypothetical protein